MDLEAMYLDLCAYKLRFVDYPNKEYMSNERMWAFWLASK